MSTLTLALSKGRILDETLPLLAQAGIVPAEDPETSRKLILPTNQAGVSLVMLRATDVPTYVQYGAADAGVAGKDVLLEHGGEGLFQPLDLGIGRCRLVVAVKRSYDWKGTVQRGARIRVATKYVKTAREHFAAKGMHVDLIKLYGSMELAPLVGLADAIVDLVSTGNTLKANDLVAVEDIMPISARLVVNPGALEDEARRRAAAARCACPRRQSGCAMNTALELRRLDTAARGFDGELGALIAFESGQDEARRRDGGADRQRCPRARRCRAARLYAPLRPPRRDVGGRAGNHGARRCGARTNALPVAQRDALGAAAARIRAFHERQKVGGWSFTEADGTELGQRVTPLDRVGVYVPGGKAAYPSSVLMNVIPAHVAGVREIVMVVPAPDGVRNRWCSPRRIWPA